MKFFGRTITRVDNADPTGKYTKDYLEKATAEGVKLAAANQAALQEARAKDKARRRAEEKAVAAILNQGLDD